MTTELIDKLTPKQTRLLAEWHARWFAVGSSCEPANRPRAEKAITAMYAEIGEKVPTYIWCDSPATACLCLDLLRRAEKDASLRSSLESSLWSSLWSSLGSSLGSAYWGQHESAWLAFYAFCRDVVGVEYDAKRSAQLDHWCEVAKSCGWWFPYHGLCVVTERPEIVRWEERETPRLHCADGPALKYRDGWTVHLWHGTMVPARLIESPETYTAADIAAETNSEIVRALAERLGWPEFLKRLDVTAVDSWTDPTTGLAYELLESRTHIGDGQPRFLRMASPTLKDGSQPQYVEPVHPDLATAQAARRWQGVDPDGTRPSVTDCNAHPECAYEMEA